MILRRLRKNSPRIARFTLGLFAAVWLNMAAQPCLMALESGSGHGATDAKMDGAAHGDEHCPHCPSDATSAPSDNERCGFVSGYDYDGRSVSDTKPNKLQPVLGLAVVWLTLPEFASSAPSLSHFLDPGGRHNPPHPILSFCRFLE